MEDKIIDAALSESIWLGMLVALVIANMGFLAYAVKLFFKKLEAKEAENTRLRDNYESKIREDLTLLIEVKRSLEEFGGGNVRVLLEKISMNIEMLLRKPNG